MLLNQMQQIVINKFICEYSNQALEFIIIIHPPNAEAGKD